MPVDFQTPLTPTEERAGNFVVSSPEVGSLLLITNKICKICIFAL